MNLDFSNFLKELYIKILVCSDTYGFDTIEKSTLRCYAKNLKAKKGNERIQATEKSMLSEAVE
jgi:hypothetical protein